MQVYDIALKAGESRQIHVLADYIYFLNGSAGGADTTIEFRPNSGGETVYLKPGQAFKLPESQRGMGITWVMKNQKGEATILGQVLMGEGEFQDNRITGAVEVIDGGKARSLAGIAYIGMVTSNAAAGSISHLQLWNPANSVRNLVIEQILSVSSVSTGIWHGVTDAAIGAGTAASITPKRIGTGYAGKAELRQAKSATQIGQVITLVNAPVSVTGTFKPNEPIVIPPGFGYLLLPQAANADVTATFEWYEDAV